MESKNMKPSEIPVADPEQLRQAGENYFKDETVRNEWIKEHSMAAAKILFTAFHAANLKTGIDITLDFEGEKYRLCFEKKIPIKN